MANENGIWILLDKSAKDFASSGIPAKGDKIMIEYKENSPIWSGMATLLGNKSQSITKQFQSPENNADIMFSPNFFKVM